MLPVRVMRGGQVPGMSGESQQDLLMDWTGDVREKEKSRASASFGVLGTKRMGLSPAVLRLAFCVPSTVQKRCPSHCDGSAQGFALLAGASELNWEQ